MIINDDKFVVLSEGDKRFRIFRQSPILKTWDQQLITENYSEVQTWFRSRHEVTEPTIIVKGLTEGILPKVPEGSVPETQDWGHGTTFTFSPKVTAFGNPVQKVLGTVFNTLAMKSKVAGAVPEGSDYTLHAGGRGTFNGKSEPSRSLTVHSALSDEEKENIASSLAKAFVQKSVAHTDTGPVKGTSMETSPFDKPSAINYSYLDPMKKEVKESQHWPTDADMPELLARSTKTDWRTGLAKSVSYREEDRNKAAEYLDLKDKTKALQTRKEGVNNILGAMKIMRNAAPSEAPKEKQPEPETNWHNSYVHESLDAARAEALHEYIGKQLDFGYYGEHVKGYTDAELHGALLDIQKTLPKSDALDRDSGGKGPSEGGYYRDQASVIRNEIAKRHPASNPVKENFEDEHGISDKKGVTNEAPNTPEFDPNGPAFHLNTNQLARMAGHMHGAGLDSFKRDPYTLLRHLSNAQASFLYGNTQNPKSEQSIGQHMDNLYGSLGYRFENEPEALALNPDASKTPDDKEIAKSLGITIEQFQEQKETFMSKNKLDEALQEALVGGPDNIANRDGEGNNPTGVPGSNTSLMLAAELMGGAAAFVHQMPTSDIFQPTDKQIVDQASTMKMGKINTKPSNLANMYERLDNAHKMALGLPITEKK